MLTFLKKRVYPAGVDVTNGFIKVAQLSFDGTYTVLQAAAHETAPEGLVHGGPEWQRWVSDTVKQLMKSGSFKGRKVVTAMPPEDVYIDQVRIPRSAVANYQKAAFEKVASRLPFDAQKAMVQYVVADMGTNSDEVDVLVMATDRNIVERHLAIYENAGLEIQGIGIWPLVMARSYIKFFSRRQHEAQTIAMLVDVARFNTNIVICRGGDLLFARTIEVGSDQINNGQMIQRVISEMEACCHYFESVAGRLRIERLLFLSGRSVKSDFCDKMAEFAAKMQIPAQIGDVLAAVESKEEGDVDRRDCPIDWTTAFGLSLSAEE